MAKIMEWLGKIILPWPQKCFKTWKLSLTLLDQSSLKYRYHLPSFSLTVLTMKTHTCFLNYNISTGSFRWCLQNSNWFRFVCCSWMHNDFQWQSILQPIILSAIQL